MILNMMVSTGSSDGSVVETSVVFHGGVNETLTLYGETNHSVVLNANGIGIATVPTGNYTIIGSVSKEALPNGKDVAITSSTSTVTAYPDGAIFWFGNGDSSGDPLYSKCGNFVADANIHPSDVDRSATCTKSVKNNTNNIELAYSYNGYGTSARIGAEFYFDKSISISGYNSINILSSGLGTFYTVNSIVTNYSYVDKKSAGSLISLTPAQYITYYFDDYLAYVNSSTLVKAIYLT